jgi:glycine/D-amino acid oxidase-like deaminating enzyme
MGGKLNVDVAIVGAGFTGLSAALHLSELGATVCVLEAGEPGWGASGRNGGQVIPGLKYDPGELERRYPGKVGEELIALVGSAPDVVFDLIHKHGIDCDATRAGWIQPAHTKAALQTVLQRAEQWHRRGVPVELLDAAETGRRLGTNQYVGAWQDPRGGSIHPLSFSRGLAAAAIRMGTEIHGCSSVTGIARVGLKWHVSTATGGLVMADQVLLCTNEYTEKLWPRLRQTIIAANSFQVATCPLPPEISSTILPGGEGRQILAVCCPISGRTGAGGSFSVAGGLFANREVTATMRICATWFTGFFHRCAAGGSTTNGADGLR